MATALWISGNPQMALYNLGNICIATPENTDNLSNYAAMLSMMGGQHLAIPILNNLNNKFPQNSTLLNNLGQAWFGLGDITKAEKYLDSAILLYAYHPQANMTKALIEESKGNITKAIEAVKKSIYHAYSSEKEEKLRKLGYKLILQDLRIPFKPGSDPLGLHRFKRPDYPKNLSELKALKPMWTNFNMECDDRITKLTNDLKEANEKYTQFVTQSATKNVQSLIKGFALPLHIKKASLKMSALRDYHATKIKVMAEKWISRNNDLIKLQRDHRKPPAEAPCETQREAENNFINKYNEQKKAIDEEVLQTFRLYANDLAYWSQFTSTDKTQFEIIILEFQIDWLKRLKQYQPLLNSEYEELDCLEDEVIANPTKLAEFDKVACNYNDTMDLQVITFYQNCSRMTSKLNLKFLEYTRYDNFDRPEGERFTGSTIKLSAERGFKNLKLDKGPLKLEAKVGASVELEFDQKGVKDINLAVEAKVGAGHNVLDEGLEEVGPIAGKDLIDNTVEIGVEGRISIVSGHGTISGSGLLKDVKLK
jgi:tetratricopeptide (TPR) repeat protein